MFWCKKYLSVFEGKKNFKIFLILLSFYVIKVFWFELREKCLVKYKFISFNENDIIVFVIVSMDLLINSNLGYFVFEV